MNKNCSEELKILISTCQIRRHSTKESLELIKSHGFEISERTFFKYKSSMKEDVAIKTRFAIDNLVLKHLQSIETLELIDKELWHEYREVQDQHLKIKILNAIRENQIYHSKFQESIPITIDKQIESIRKLPLRNKLDSKRYLEEAKISIQRQIEAGPIFDAQRSQDEVLKHILENLDAE
jgi:hypothetical protein